MSSDSWKVLGLQRGASLAEVKTAYRKLSFKYHPDRNPEDPQAAEKFREVKKAHEELSDPEKRLAAEGKVGFTDKPLQFAMEIWKEFISKGKREET